MAGALKQSGLEAGDVLGEPGQRGQPSCEGRTRNYASRQPGPSQPLAQGPRPRGGGQLLPERTHGPSSGLPPSPNSLQRRLAALWAPASASPSVSGKAHYVTCLATASCDTSRPGKLPSSGPWEGDGWLSRAGGGVLDGGPALPWPGLGAGLRPEVGEGKLG